MLLWTGELISSIGGGLTSFGLGVYVFGRTGSAASMALVTMLGFLPTLLLSVPAGVLADRHDRRLLMMICKEKCIMEKIPTKDRILDSALTLFSERGYDGVGVDLIAENAGIKGPSLYKHFKGKEDILDSLIEKVESYYQDNFGSVLSPGKIPGSMDELITLSLKRIEFTLHDPMIKKVRRMLTMEQFRNHRIALLTTKYNIDSVQGIYHKLFQAMMDNGIMRKTDPALLAMSFAAPVSLLIQMCDREPEREQEAMERAKEYFRYFADEYDVKTKQ